MQTGYLMAHLKRSWYIPNLAVWGTDSWGTFDYLVVEQVNNAQSLLYNDLSIGATSQQLQYNQLTDFRGNQLPETIINPKILFKPKSNHSAYIVGQETNSQFTIARDSSAPGPVEVDLYIIEMG